ncbi:hypothetical protein P8452_72589 [Trifolium repens]|jgi:hypothetical protein|nr:hypothetical protein P8452_72589 [Trifolium repens]
MIKCYLILYASQHKELLEGEREEGVTKDEENGVTNITTITLNLIILRKNWLLRGQSKKLWKHSWSQNMSAKQDEISSYLKTIISLLQPKP